MKSLTLSVVAALALSACGKKEAQPGEPSGGTAAPAVAAPQPKIAVHGLEKSVSQYVFDRCVEKRGADPTKYVFKNMDPGAAAVAMQQRQTDVAGGIMVWNPFVIDTLSKRPDARVQFDSTAIPAEVIDMVVVAQAALDKPGGEAFAKATAETYYAVNALIADPATRDATLIAIGERFSSQGLEGMRKVVQQTLFYNSPARGIGLFTGGDAFPFQSGVTSENFQTAIMPRVVDYVATHGWADRKPTIAFGTKAQAPQGTNLRFDTSYMEAVRTPKTRDIKGGITDCAKAPSFTLAWSEYPSWSTFGVAHARGLISGEKGKCGPIERAYGVDIELKELEYGPCIDGYASGALDAVCLTNMDALAPSLGRPSVAIMPTSTSYGADAYLVTQ